MSVAAHPAALWLAAVACMLMALRGRRPRRAVGPAAAHGLPAPMRTCIRLGPPSLAPVWLTRPADAANIATAALDGALPPGHMARARLGSLCMALPIAGAALILGPVGLPIAAAVLGLASAYPGRWLAQRARRRRAALVRELPDLLDLLGICVEAGMALDPALGLSAERLGGTVGDEIGRTLGDLRFGMPRAAAYRSMVERMGAPDLTQAVAALLQADELGAPLSGALAGQAAALRAGRRQAARDRAAKAAPKIQLVVALLMVPAVLILVLGVLVIELSRQVGAVMGGG